VFALFDVHDNGLVRKLEIAYELLQIKDIVSAELDLTKILDFDSF
jgi:hypothetical protein